MRVTLYQPVWSKTHVDFFFHETEFNALKEGIIKTRLPPVCSFEPPRKNGEPGFLRVPSTNKEQNREVFAFMRRLDSSVASLERERRRKVLTDECLYYHTVKDLEVIWAVQQGRCYYTGEPLGETFAERKFSVDHKDSLNGGGEDHPDNIVLTTHKTNTAKSWMNGAEYFRKIKASEEIRKRAREIDRVRRAHFKKIDRLKCNRRENTNRENAEENRLRREERKKARLQIKMDAIYLEFPEFLLPALNEKAPLKPMELVKVVADQISVARIGRASIIRSSDQLREAKRFLKRWSVPAERTI